MSRALKYDIPGPDWRVEPERVRDEGWEKIFAPVPAAPLVVEIGFGRGEFLRALAEASPGTAHLGVEVSFKRVLKLARRLACSELVNVRLVAAPAEEVLRDLLAPASVHTFWINFPDPWPKKRHARRRLLSPAILARLADRLEPGGHLHVATDHVAYAEEIDADLRAEPALENALAEPFVRDVPGRMRTAYELEWRAEGRPLHFWHYTRPGRGE